MVKKVLLKVMQGIGYGSTVSIIVTTIGAWMQGVSFLPATAAVFTRQALCSVVVGIAFVLPTLVYDSQRLALWAQSVIHMGIGFLVFFPVAFYAGWMPVAQGAGFLVITIGFMLIISFLIWLGFYLYYRAEAKRMNQQIQKKNQLK